jgi:hypothetical protein
MRWTDERIKACVEMWGRAVTATEIAKSLGVTRNAVAGLMYRIGVKHGEKLEVSEKLVLYRSRRQRSARLARKACIAAPWSKARLSAKPAPKKKIRVLTIIPDKSPPERKPGGVYKPKFLEATL